jgi:hypothetical protein
VTSIAKGMWSRPIRRIALAHAAYLPIAFITVLPILFIGAEHIWPWVAKPLYNGKEVWLNLPFMATRTIFGLLLLMGVSLAFAYTALRPDMGLLRDRCPHGCSRPTTGSPGTGAARRPRNCTRTAGSPCSVRPPR